MIRTAACACILFAISGVGDAWAHGGGLNASGCHNNRKTGGYHCHRSGGSSRSSAGTGSGFSLYGTPATEPPAPAPLYRSITPLAAPIPAIEPRSGLLPSTPQTIGTTPLPPLPDDGAPRGDAVLHALLEEMQASMNALRSEVLDLRLRVMTLESR